ncbi:hypothetical protein [Pengzhenrongella sp.]|uniref:hypothetical protein n=1 Tax=Pengzhenrongella sp. TaxID=2888820 RepID=UPI002F92DE06
MKVNHVAAQRFWRPRPDDVTIEAGKTAVGSLAAAETVGPGTVPRDDNRRSDR